MNPPAGASAPSAASVRDAVDPATFGSKRGAVPVGRLLLGIGADTAEPVMADIEAVLAAADPRLWVALENAREWLAWDVGGRAGGVVSPPVGSDVLPGVLVKVLLADGRVREQAVRLLAGSSSLAVLPVLGLRAADWVPSIRGLAREAILRRLADDPDGAVLATLAPMAFLLAGRQRGRWLVDEVTARLAAAASGPVVRRLLTSPDTRLRRAGYQVVIDGGELDLDGAVRGALRDRDIVIRTRCAAYASRLAVESGSAPAARRMLASRTPLVRAEALQALNRLGDLDTIRASLVDRSALVRGTARFYLRPHGVDFREIYLLRLGAGGDAVTPGAVAGLAEVGTADDGDLIRSLVGHPLPGVRIEALRGLAAPVLEIDEDALLRLLETDPSAAVIRQAAAILVARGVDLDPDRLLDLLDPARPAPVRLAARRLLAARDDGWRLAVDVMLLADLDATLASAARRDLVAGLGPRGCARPGGKPAELLAAHLPDADRLLTAAQSRQLRFAVGMRLPAPPPAEPVTGHEAEPAPAGAADVVAVRDEPGKRFAGLHRAWRR